MNSWIEIPPKKNGFVMDISQYPQEGKTVLLKIKRRNGKVEVVLGYRFVLTWWIKRFNMDSVPTGLKVLAWKEIE